MAKCTDCGSETELSSGGLPICVTCSDHPDDKPENAHHKIKSDQAADKFLRAYADKFLRTYLEATDSADEL